MANRKPPSKGLGKVNPDDYFNYEDQFLERGGGGKGSGGKGPKTLQDLRRQERQAARDQRQSELEAALRTVLTGFLDYATRENAERFLASYVSWVESNLDQLAPLDPGQIEIKFSKSGGPGGQNVNKRETRVALLHKPTRIGVVNDQTRSQSENRQRALAQLRQRLEDHLRDWKLYLGARQIDVQLVQELLERES